MLGRCLLQHALGMLQHAQRNMPNACCSKPDDLYKGGLQRPLFVPFIDLLKVRV